MAQRAIQNTAVVYFTKGGAAARYAETVAETLRGVGHSVDLIDLRRRRKPDLAPYDNVVLGTGVRIGMVYRKAKRFLRRADLDNKRLAIFLASGIAIEEPGKSKAKFLQPIVEKYGLEPVMYDAFPGYTPGPKDTTPDTTNLARAAEWARELAERLTSD